ncbi:MAG: gamma-glutamyl-gamma-aminobutyrate hydrolase family protein [Pseudonocardiaceae bacterium]
MASNDSDPHVAVRRPLIGLTAYAERVRYLAWDHDAALLPSTYLDAIVRSGGIPVLLPPVEITTNTLATALDGLVLSGGGDVDAAQYGEAPHPANSGMRPSRDTFELSLLRAALDHDLPVLAVCRGVQVLNVALGGSLIQHLPDVVGHDGHRPRLGVFGPIRVRLAAESRVGQILGTDVKVTCSHHQALGRVADGLDVVGWAEDGTVEAVERPGHSFMLGVQWHPEQDSADDRLFTALVTAAGIHADGQSRLQ